MNSNVDERNDLELFQKSEKVKLLRFVSYLIMVTPKNAHLSKVAENYCSEVVMLPHPPCSYDIVPSDFYLFRSFRNFFEWIRI